MLIFLLVSVSTYEPRLSIFPLRFPTWIYQLLQYLASISGGLGLLNLAPIYQLDGQYVCETVLEIIPLPALRRQQIMNFLQKATLVLLLLNVILSFW